MLVVNVRTAERIRRTQPGVNVNPSDWDELLKDEDMTQY